MNHRTRVKICGITCIKDAQQVAAFGADAIGLVFHRHSPRAVSIETATKIRQAMPPFVTITALLMDENPAWIEQVVEEVNPDCLQFHGQEPPGFCQQWGSPYIKAIPMASVTDAKVYAEQYEQALGFLMDSNVAGSQGGSGDTFDWSIIPSDFDHPLVLAGGLTPSNVSTAIKQVKPWAVDVSTGVEKSRGIKDANLIQQFFDEVNRSDLRCL
jgi:phosphoribosylanthranilate isomerase